MAQKPASCRHALKINGESDNKMILDAFVHCFSIHYLQCLSVLRKSWKESLSCSLLGNFWWSYLCIEESPNSQVIFWIIESVAVCEGWTRKLLSNLIRPLSLDISPWHWNPVLPKRIRPRLGCTLEVVSRRFLQGALNPCCYAQRDVNSKSASNNLSQFHIESLSLKL